MSSSSALSPPREWQRPFVRLDLEHPEKLAVSPRTLIDDNIAFRQAT
ncbi:MAG: hypothetical protein QOF84_2311 [Streptomyces sp.]|jgi:hypothetical protein|nr:hypothetical protein [Streptomyces sp.]MDX6347521.1 hypothetical protein [Streptomyces sp.]